MSALLVDELTETTSTVAATPATVVVTETFWHWRHGRIRVWETDPHPSGKAIVLLHGYGAMVEHWRKNIPALAADATVYALDLLGFGKSDMPDAHYSARLWGEQVRDFLDARRIAKATLFGHSMGGLVAAQFAHDYAERTDGLVLVDPSGYPPRTPSDFMFRTLRFAAENPILRDLSYWLFATPDIARQGLTSAYFDPRAVTPELVETFVAPLRQPGAKYSYLAVARRPGDFFVNAPNGIAAPTLLVWGGRDRLLPPRLLKPFRELIPHAESVVIPDTGHCPQDETPSAFNAVTLRFLRMNVFNE
ncbi:alpha/beta fold hydrolase [Chloracidobacterium validum]|uniref:Alpha/beta fold hydrolase n=1 Tax=Chloracidobacterium validum TaxID=2821543 RepID=A0ABX8B4Z9_9BACT|nr:alpha/beta fold hydrolase [Chloracidobacterium validum]QUW02052.1 alpha/beta fold hydrolase [Chloracidobacterium validum]